MAATAERERPDGLAVPNANGLVPLLPVLPRLVLSQAAQWDVQLTWSRAVIDGWPNQFVTVSEKGQLPGHVPGLERYDFLDEFAIVRSSVCSVNEPGATPGVAGLVPLAINCSRPLAALTA